MGEFEAVCEKEWGIKERTQKGYAVIICNLYYIYKRNEDTFLKLGHPNVWQGSYYLIQTNNGLNSDPVQTQKSLKFRPKSDHNGT